MVPHLKQHAFVGWVAELSTWVAWNICNIFSAKPLSLAWCCLVDLMVKVWRNKTYWKFNNSLKQIGASVGCGTTIHSHNSLAPPPHAGHQPGHTLLQDGIPFFNQHPSQVSQHGCVGQSGTNNTPKLIPQVFKGVEYRTLWQAILSSPTQILQVVSEKPLSSCDQAGDKHEKEVPGCCGCVCAPNKSQYQNKLFGREDLAHLSWAQPTYPALTTTNACSLQMWHHLKWK